MIGSVWGCIADPFVKVSYCKPILTNRFTPYFEGDPNFDYEIYLKENNSFIGMIGLHSLAWSHDRCEIGYWISKSYEGKGFVSESVIALEQKCFELGFNRLEIRCDPNNIKSGLLAEKCGYTLEGILRENTVHLESYRSTKVFSKIRSDLK